MACDPRTVEPRFTEIYGHTLASKLRACRSPRGLSAVLSVPFLDRDGNPVSLHSCVGGSYTGDFDTPVMRFREATGLRPTVIDAEDPAISDDGLSVTGTVPDGVANCPGVWKVDVVTIDADDRINRMTSILFLVERSSFVLDGSAPSKDVGPPTVDEIRTALRDTPEGNLLRDEFEHDEAEIGDAIVRAVQSWNSARPDVHVYFTTLNFPIGWRVALLDGIIANLLSTAAFWYARSDLEYQAGGVAVNDLRKDQPYTAKAEALKARFDEWCRDTKIRLNMESGFGVFGSPYGELSGGYGVY